MELNENYKVSSDLEPPIICLPNNIPISFFDSMVKKLNLSVASKEFSITLSFFFSSKDTESKEGIYVSSIHIADICGKSRAWRNKVLNEMVIVGLFKKVSYVREGIGGRNPNCFFIKVPDDFKGDKSNKEKESNSLISPYKNMKNIILSDNYIEKRPSTLIHMVSFIMNCLPFTQSTRSSYSTTVRLENKNLACNVRGLAGENIAYEPDIRILIAICSFVEDLIFQELSKNKKMTTSLYAPLDVEVSSIVKYINGKGKNGKFKSGGGYNDVVINAMKRLSWTRIDIIEEESETTVLEGLLRNERYIQPLTLAIPYSTKVKGDHIQMIQFQIFPSVIKILEQNVKLRMNGNQPVQTMLMNNLLIQQADNEIRRILVQIYSLISLEIGTVSMSWRDIFDWRKHSNSENKYKTILIDRIQSVGIKEDPENEDQPCSYLLYGLSIEITEDGINATLIEKIEYDDILELLSENK